MNESTQTESGDLAAGRARPARPADREAMKSILAQGAPRPLLPHILTLHGRWRPRQPALVCRDGMLTWSELDRRANRVARALAELGLEPRARIALIAGNELSTVETLVGIFKAGLVAVPLNPAVTDGDLAGMIADCGARVLCAGQPHAARADGWSRPDLVRRICLSGTAGSGWIGYRAWLRDVPDTDPGLPVDGESPCNIIYSSGTTGNPKGIVHTYACRTEWAADLALAFRYHSGCRTLVATGIHSNLTWIALLCTFLAGGTLHLHDGFDAARVIDDIERGRLTHAALVPLQYRRIVDDAGFHPDRVRSMRAMISAGSALGPALKRRLLDAFPGALIDVYGSTEGALTCIEPEEAGEDLESVGRPISGVDVTILGDDDRPVPPGMAGEIVSHSRFVMAGYWNRPDATAESTWIDDAGRPWLRTGDIGRVDDSGRITILGRKKDMILSGGQNIYPADLEAVLGAHPDVAECAVVAAPSAQWGETPVAFVVLGTGATAAPEALAAWANERLGRQQRIHAVHLRDALPRNHLGKILKRELQAGLAQA